MPGPFAWKTHRLYGRELMEIEFWKTRVFRRPNIDRRFDGRNSSRLELLSRSTAKRHKSRMKGCGTLEIALSLVNLQSESLEQRSKSENETSIRIRLALY